MVVGSMSLGRQDRFGDFGRLCAGLALAFLTMLLLASCATGRAPGWIAGGPQAPVQPELELELEAAWVIDNRDGPADLAGLAQHGGRLFTVSRSDPEGVWEIAPPLAGQERARLRRHLTLDLPPLRRDRGEIEFAGITADPDGRLHLISRNYSRILVVAPDGKVTGWLETPDLEGPAQAQGLLATARGRWNGIAWVGPGQFYLVAEREPRGLQYLQLARYRTVVKAVNLDSTRYPPGRGRIPDFGDLFYDGRTLWALQRNAEVITPLVSTAGNRIVEGAAWSFRATAASPDLPGRGGVPGLAEGLALDDGRIYILYDSRRGRVEADGRGPLLLVFRRPMSGGVPAGKLP